MHGAQVCSPELSHRYVQRLWLEVRVLVSTKAALSLTFSLSERHRRAMQPSKQQAGQQAGGARPAERLANLIKSDTVLQSVGRVLQVCRWPLMAPDGV
jgi:hypothetical protein